MKRKYTQEELDNISKSIDDIVKIIVENSPDFTEEIVEYKKLLLNCETIDRMSIINKIIELQLNCMNKHPEIYPKYVSKKE